VLARTNRLTVAIVVLIVAVAAAWATYPATSRAQPARSFCSTTGTGSTASAAIHNYLTRCGPDYSIQAGPFSADKSTSAYANYAQVVEYRLLVKHNAEGRIAFLMVGKRGAGDKWHTLGPPGTGP
jgi:hypothetical protein